jgi:hypothetical protein
LCPKGFYRVGCSDGPGTGTSGATYDNVQCVPCSSCPDGHFISSECPGSGFSPLQRTCTQCATCGAGKYYASGCTGNQTSGNSTCSDCQSYCPIGMYMSLGCNGTTSRPTAEKCSACLACTAAATYISVPCSGRGTSATNRTCSPCTCPLGFTPYVPCVKQGTSNHVCISGDGQIFPLPTSAPPAFATSSSTTASRAFSTTTTATTSKAGTTVHAFSTTTPAPLPAPTPSKKPGDLSEYVSLKKHVSYTHQSSETLSEKNPHLSTFQQRAIIPAAVGSDVAL